MTALTKPVKRSTPARVPHGITPILVIMLYPGGMIGLRELGRRREYQVEAGALYARLVQAEVAERRRSPERRRRNETTH